MNRLRVIVLIFVGLTAMVVLTAWRMGIFDRFFKQGEAGGQTGDSGEAAPDFVFPLIAVKGGEAYTRISILRNQWTAGGSLPVIVGARDDLERLEEGADEAFSMGDGRRFATTELPSAWFDRQLADDPEAYESLNSDEFYPEGSSPMVGLQVGTDHGGKEVPAVWIARVPASESWELPLHLRFGSWNSCPEPGVHAMLARYWGEKYGAEIAVITADTIEFTVSRPPRSKEACDELAREMFIYCPDIVDQGVGSVPTLSKCIEGSKFWYFWWD